MQAVARPTPRRVSMMRISLNKLETNGTTLGPVRYRKKARREKIMKQDQIDLDFVKNAGFVLACLAIALLTAVPLTAAAGAPPAFTFKDRCVPYEVDPAFMAANGVDPNKIIDAFVDDGDADGGTGNLGSVSPCNVTGQYGTGRSV